MRELARIVREVWMHGGGQPAPHRRGSARLYPHGAGTRTARERRVFERVTVEKSVLVSELSPAGTPGAPWACRVLNVSRAGLALCSRRMVHPGRSLLIRIGVQPGGPEWVLCGVVRQSRYAPGEGYALGLEFRALPRSRTVRQWMEVHDLVAPHPLAAARDDD